MGRFGEIRVVLTRMGTSGKDPDTISGPRNWGPPEKGPGRPSHSPAQSSRRSPEDAAARPAASGGSPGDGEGAAGERAHGLVSVGGP